MAIGIWVCTSILQRGFPAKMHHRDRLGTGYGDLGNITDQKFGRHRRSTQRCEFSRWRVDHCSTLPSYLPNNVHEPEAHTKQMQDWVREYVDCCGGVRVSEAAPLQGVGRQ